MSVAVWILAALRRAHRMRGPANDAKNLKEKLERITCKLL